MDESVVCPLCVQWRCTLCGLDDCDHWLTEDDAMEPYWVDGTVAVLTSESPCERCQETLALMHAEREHGAL